MRGGGYLHKKIKYLQYTADTCSEISASSGKFQKVANEP